MLVEIASHLTGLLFLSFSVVNRGRCLAKKYQLVKWLNYHSAFVNVTNKIQFKSPVQGNIYASNELEFDSPVWQKKLFPAFGVLFWDFSMCCDVSETSAALRRWACCSQLYHKPVMNNKDEISYHVTRLKMICHCLLLSSQKEGTFWVPKFSSDRVNILFPLVACLYTCR